MDASDYPCLYRLRFGAAAFAALVGLLALVGWVVGIPDLTQLHPGLQPVTPFGSLFLLITAAALLTEGVLARVLASVVFLAGLGVAGADLTGLASSPALPLHLPGLIVAINMLLGGVALLLRDVRSPRGVWAAQICALLVVLNALHTILGFLIADKTVSFLITTAGPSPQGALSMMLLGLGLLATRPDGGFMRLLVSARAGGRLLRWLIIIAFSITLAAGLISVLAWRAGLFGTETVVILVLLATLIIFYRTAVVYDSADQGRLAAEGRLALANAELERRVAERSIALQSREAQIRAIDDNLPDTLIYQLVRDERGHEQFTYLSAGVAHITGYSAEAIIANSHLLYEQIVPEDRPRFAAAQAAATQAFSTFDVEVRRQTPKGLRWSHIRSHPCRLAGGRVAWDGIEVDITAQKTVEAALMRDRRYQAALFACAQALLHTSAITAAERDAALFDVLGRLLEGASADGVFFIRTAEDGALGRCLEIPILISAAGISGALTPKDPLRVALAQLSPWIQDRLGTDEPSIIKRGDLGDADASLGTLFDSFTIQSIVVFPLWPDSQAWGGVGFQSCTAPREWDDQEILLLRTAAKLISGTLRRWQDEDELRRREALLTALFDLLPIGVALIDPRWRPLRLNHAASQIVGLDLPTLLGGAYRQICYIHPDGRPVTLDEFPATRAIRGAIVRDMELGVIRPDGQLRWTTMSAAPLPMAGYGAALVIVDITERKQIEAERLGLERKLLETQRLESLGVLAGGVAHDFNNILTAILGHAELARMDLPPASEVIGNLDAIVLGARRAADLTGQMLAYAGRGRFLTEAIDLNMVVQELDILVRATLPLEISVRHFLTPDLPPIIADGTQVRQVLLNLLTNAAEALTGMGGGTLAVATGHCALTAAALAGASFSAAQPGRFGYLEVRDSGCGIDAATLARIFDPFFSTKLTGRGLGLAAVQGIVRGHRGALFVQSVPGTGSTFRVCFPASLGVS